ncbi:Ubiquitin-like protein [Hirsutella rhossiliensis]|uniref:Ubiquitin-like protein n=1 Tax=Hirsutella rhossiliensis TaxID=111463 RepID=A0A9P8N3G4_9HYPO|nr:Ubiquitin-like protein [Hirsutella rhossiliensis]KAH0965159.1 Ubiquitin-like protein [Hirsutella rhossiliensis]
MVEGPGSVSAPVPPPAAAAAVPAEPLTAPPPPPKPAISRYRSLRGKSVSSLRPFDIFRNSASSCSSSSSTTNTNTTNTHHTLSASSSTVDSSNDDERHNSEPLLHRRSKTATATASPSRHATRPPPLPDFSPTSVLSPRPVNATLKPSLTALGSLKTPIESVKETLLQKAAASANSRAAAATASAGDTNLHATNPLIALGEGADSDRGNDQENNRPSNNHNDDKIRKDDAIVHSIVASPPPAATAPAEAQQPETPPPKHSAGAQTKHVNTDEAALLAERLEAETDRILAEQKKLDLARLQAQLVTPPPKPCRRPLLDTFAFLARGRRSNAKNPSQPGTPSTISPSIFSPALAGSGSLFSRNSSVDDSLRMSFIEPGGKGIVPQFDAPASAINGGERRVIVRCLSSTTTLPFTADTSPVDIVVASAEKTNHVITPTTCVVIECYFVLGLERRLRRYERVRDVLNSWDNDEQNSLLILPCDSPKDDRGLDLDSVPRTDDPPPGFCLQLHHSARPGKWNKRWVTLLDSGQVFASKRAEASPLDKDSIVLCHLSDFDIYSPKESEMRRNLKPPKKFCYAIKSQQKTNVFPNGENFVHFFCTDDDKLASRFYEMVHGWRSWYLVNRDAGKSTEKGPRVSIDETSYRSEEPLMDVSGFKVPDVPRVDTTLTKRSSKDSPRSKGQTPPWSETTDKEREFFAGGLLGDAYDKRKQDEVANTQTRGHDAKADGPFTVGPSLLNGGVSGAAEAPERRPMTADAAAQLRREKQQQHHHQQPPSQPLLSFGKDFPEPPRFRDAHGHGPRHAAGQPLINFATGGPPQLHNAPPQRAMSRRGASGSVGGGRRFSPEELPPVPALPNRSVRRDKFGEAHHGGGPSARHAEPLVNRAR